ncbi:hypothetical protein [Rubellimicrobium arenae]|uniref:hypothetical protein n=1 Tax=Rubellimicrobium arenae TaxID=2817372 RepID=UPI001B316A06|nr:hypothetical protein [Rubellimicrobium arenae]
MHHPDIIYPATVLRQTRSALKLQGEPKCSVEAHRQGWAELLAHHSEGDGLCPIELLCLERALDRYLSDVSRQSDACYARVDFETLAEVVGGRKVARLGLLLAGVWARQVRGAQVWTDAPSGSEREPAGLATFDDVFWDEREFVPRAGGSSP